MISYESWLSTVRREYLQGFVQKGGSAVKFVVTDTEQCRELMREKLYFIAQEEDFCSVHVDARDTKVHVTDRFFHQVSRLIDWSDLAYRFVSRLLVENGYQLPNSRDQFNLAGVASLNQRAEPLLRRDLNAWLEQAIFRDPHMCQEFRMAMIRLCLAQLDTGDTSPFLTKAVTDWLCGELKQISAVKEALIFQKIVRHNARHMFASLARWFQLVGKRGLVLTLDLSQYMVSKRADQPDTGLYYSVSAAMDAYEMLRQFIDSTDEIEGLLLIVLTPPEFLTDQRRGLNRYEALKLRIWDEVRDRHHQNPLGALIRVHTNIESENQGSEIPEEEQDGASVMLTGNVFHQRVIEALRSGVPNADVVRALGSNQPEIEGKFRRVLQHTTEALSQGQMGKGMLIEGGFGTGKSHLLKSLHHMALEQNYVCSQIVISKETPFHNVMTLFRAAIDSAVVPNKRGHALTEVAGELNFQSPQYSEFFEWTQRQSGDIDSRFAATLYLYEQMVNDPELSHRMIRFWAGDPISNSDLKKYLQGCESKAGYTFNKISTQALALERFKFAARLMVAAGYSGWILLIDEAEIIGRYSFKQRTKSYGELARWMGSVDSCQFPGLATVVALTDDFQSVVLEEKGDREKISSGLAAAVQDVDQALFNHADHGVRLIEQHRIPLIRPYDQVVDETYQKIRSMHASAYCWEPPEVSSVEQLSSTRIREYVRGWITEWDLRRLVPGEEVEIEMTELKQDYSEDVDLEVAVEDTHGSDPSYLEERVFAGASENR